MSDNTRGYKSDAKRFLKNVRKQFQQGNTNQDAAGSAYPQQAPFSGRPLLKPILKGAGKYLNQVVQNGTLDPTQAFMNELSTDATANVAQQYLNQAAQGGSQDVMQAYLNQVAQDGSSSAAEGYLNQLSQAVGTDPMQYFNQVYQNTSNNAGQAFLNQMANSTAANPMQDYLNYSAQNSQPNAMQNYLNQAYQNSQPNAMQNFLNQATQHTTPSHLQNYLNQVQQNVSQSPAQPHSNSINNPTNSGHSYPGPPAAANNPGGPVGNAASLGPTAVPAAPVHSSIIPAEIIEQINSRPYSVIVKFGEEAIFEACKGLSRVITPGNIQDLQLFGNQLRASDKRAFAENYEHCLKDRVHCFAVSYVQKNEGVVGRFKFTGEQWENLQIALSEIRKAGVQKCRLWLDQCLWIRDVSQASWAHTGLLPYVLWPVISLSTKVAGQDRTMPTFERMWPFVEEVAGLWSLGVITTKEFRDSMCKPGDERKCLSFNHRLKLEPEESFWLLLLNIYHGAANALSTGWTEDVKELREMARWNVECTAPDPIVGPGWRNKVTSFAKHPSYAILQSLQISKKVVIGDFHMQGQNVWLDGSRKWARGSWDGFHEWTSGNNHDCTFGSIDEMIVSTSRTMLNCVTDKGEFQILSMGTAGQSLSLLVAMDGRSSGITRGKVAWTKVISGASSCNFPAHDFMTTADDRVVAQILHEQLGERVQIFGLQYFTGKIEWV